MVVLLIAYSIELLQLTPILTFFNLKDSISAKLILGSTFHMSDIAAYTLGINTVLLIELYYGNIKKTHTIKI